MLDPTLRDAILEVEDVSGRNVDARRAYNSLLGGAKRRQRRSPKRRKRSPKRRKRSPKRRKGPVRHIESLVDNVTTFIGQATALTPEEWVEQTIASHSSKY